MGSKRTGRSAATRAKAAGITSSRSQRKLDREKKQHEKMLARQQAALDVAHYEKRVDRIASVHLECSDRIDWAQIAARAAPVEPRKNRSKEDAARKSLADFAPTRMDRLIGGDVKKRRKLEAAIDAAVRQDAEDFRMAHGRWLATMEDWRRTSGLARRVLAGDPEAKVEAVRRFGRFAEISGIGSNIVVRIGKAGFIEATLTGHGRDIVPTDVLSQLKSGKLSEKKMPVGKFNELHRKHLCSCLVRAANELFSLLPDNEVIVTITDKLADSARGDLQNVPVVSARIQRQALDALDLTRIDPCDVVTRFTHNMSFRKIKGFRPVAPVDSGRVRQ